MTYDEIFRVIFAGSASIISLFPVAKFIRTAQTGILETSGTMLFRGHDPRAFRTDLWFEATAIVLMCVAAVLMWTLPQDAPDGGFSWTSAAAAWGVFFMSWTSRRVGNPWARQHPVICFLLFTAVTAGAALILRWLGL